MNRYTSPELSKQLAEAGLEQGVPEMTLRMVWGKGERLGQRVGKPCECADCKPNVRALDLHDCIKELTKERDGGALADVVDMAATSDSSQYVGARKRNTARARASAVCPDIVEAAGRVLLALLKERAK